MQSLEAESASAVPCLQVTEGLSASVLKASCSAQAVATDNVHQRKRPAWSKPRRPFTVTALLFFRGFLFCRGSVLGCSRFYFRADHLCSLSVKCCSGRNQPYLRVHCRAASGAGLNATRID